MLLAVLAGYGFRLRRILGTYAFVVLLFAAGYFVSGRLPGQTDVTQLGLDTFQSWLATAESIAGIVIEGAFVAMLIQRFFGR